jgi:hypothetical protein
MGMGREGVVMAFEWGGMLDNGGGDLGVRFENVVIISILYFSVESLACLPSREI